MEIIVNEGVKQQEIGNQEEVKNQIAQKYEFEKIADSQDFRQLITRKKKFLIPLTAIFLSLYFLLPVLTSYTKILHKPAIGSITWVWIYSLGLFIMTWTLCMVYVRKAAKFDQQAQQVIEKHHKQGEQNV